MNQNEPPQFPSAEFVRRGPPVGVRDLHRAAQEKWARVVVVEPSPEDTPDRTRYDFAQKGPFTLPLAVLREGADKGSQDAWLFFTHPYAVFPEESTFYNVPGKGCLGARLFVRGQQGVRLYDEVGAGLAGAEFVAETYAGALGVLRRRILSSPDAAAASPLAPDLLELDIDLLEVFYSLSLLLKAEDPLAVLERLYRLCRRRTLNDFAWDVFSEEEQDLMRKLRGGELDEEQRAAAAARFHVREEDFTKITDVKDGQGRQAIREMLGQWSAFEKQHGEQLARLSAEIQAAEARFLEIKQRVKDLSEGSKTQSGLSRLFSRSDKAVRELKGEAVVAVRRKRALEEEYDRIPGYERVRGLTERVRGFQGVIASIFRMARDLVDHNVTRAQVNSLRALSSEKLLSGDPDALHAGFRQYDLRLRAEVLPRVLATYSFSAYLLRRPDALPRGVPSHRNVERINTLARRLIEYFRYVRYGEKDLGEAFDSAWGQVLNLEARL